MNKRVTQLTARLILLIAGFFAGSATAQTLGVSGNSVSISAPGFSQSVTLASSGVVPAVTGVPTSGTLTTPTFSFTLAQVGAESTVGTFNVGIVLDEASSQRQLEVFIPGVSMTFDAGGVLTGTLTTPNVNIYGRDASGAVLAAASVASGGSVNFNGSSLSFSAADQITLIQTQGGILGDIVSSVDNTGLSYNYKVILKETTAVGYQFGSTGPFTAFPTATAGEFVIGVGGNAADSTALSGGYMLTGTVTFGAASGGGGGSSSTDEAAIDEGTTDLNNELGAIDPADPAAASQVNTALDSATTLATTATTAISDGGITTTAQVNTVLDGLTAISNTVKKAGDTVTAGTTPSPAKVTASTNSLTATLVALKAANAAGTLTLTAAQKTQINSLSATTLTGLSDTVTTATTAANKSAAQAAASDLVAASMGASGNLSTDLQTAAKALAAKLQTGGTGAKAARSASTSVNGAFASFTSAIAGISSTFLQDSPITITVPSSSALLSVLQVYKNSIPGITVCLGGASSTPRLSTGSTCPSGTVAALNRRLAAAQAGGDSIAAIEDDEIVPTANLDVLIMPASQADGINILPDGSVLSVSEGIGFVVAPTILNETAFVDGLTALGATITRNADYSLTITADGATIVGTVGFEGLAATGTSATGNATFGLPASGDESDLGYVLMINYADGRSQKLQPFTASAALYDSIEALGFTVATDRATGVINIEGVGNFRPGYLVTDKTFADLTYLNANKDADGVAYRLVDANGDGVSDVEVVSDTGVQVLYGMP